ncbi:MAG TPA: alpha/beta fold hydrolase [Sporichthya sp.]|nr:alpha/beta fold hydrolase [Sporichthya sp.]
MTEISPAPISISDDDLKDLRERLARTRWPDAETVADWSQGIPLSYVQEVCEYWATGYDWRRAEAALNALEPSRTTIDGVDVHFLHARSPEPHARPLVLTHGWPGSVLEFLNVIEPLRNPAAHGGDPADAFHVVCPSIPGYGFSGKPRATGWGVTKVAAAIAEVMNRLGYPRFRAQGGDWGAIITTMLGAHHADVVEGIHINLAICNPEALGTLGEPTAEEQAQLGLLGVYMTVENGYAQQQMTRPQTLGYGLADSPAGQCAWILEKFQAWSGIAHPEDGFSRDHLLDNISAYWLTNSGASSARLYWESLAEVFSDFTPATAPSAYTVFPSELFQFSERWARTRYTDLRYYNVAAAGGHFAAMQQPELFVDEVRAAFRAIG